MCSSRGRIAFLEIGLTKLSGFTRPRGPLIVEVTIIYVHPKNWLMRLRYFYRKYCDFIMKTKRRHVKVEEILSKFSKNNPFYIKIPSWIVQNDSRIEKNVSPCLSAKLEKLWQGSWVRIVVAPSGLPQLLKYDIGGQNCPKNTPCFCHLYI